MFLGDVFWDRSGGCDRRGGTTAVNFLGGVSGDSDAVNYLTSVFWNGCEVAAAINFLGGVS